MVRTFLTKTFSTLTEAFQNCLKRFPITVCFAIALTGYLIYWVTIEKRRAAVFYHSLLPLYRNTAFANSPPCGVRK